MPPKFEDIDWDEYYGCDEDARYFVDVDAPVPEGGLPVGINDIDDDEDAVFQVPFENDDDRDPVVFDYTDCGGEGDRLIVERWGDALWFQVEGAQTVILRDAQVSDLMSALVEYQDDQPEADDGS